MSAGALAQAIQAEAKNFTFIVGSAEYKCCRFQACMISERIYRMVTSDQSVDSFEIEASDSQNTFNEIMKLMNGEEIEVNSTNAPILAAWARELENNELLQVAGSFNVFSSSNMGEIIQLKKQLKQDISGEIAHIASHFDDFDVGFFASLSVDDVEAVLRSDSLKLASEDDLFDLVESLVVSNKACLSLFRFVHFQNLTEENLAKYLDRVYPDLLNGPLWESLTQALLTAAKPAKPVEQPTPPEPMQHRDTSRSPQDGVFNGLINYLRGVCGGNPHDRGIMEVTASSSGRFGVQVQQIMDYGWSGWWHTHNIPDQFVCFDFKECLVNITGYTIMADGGDNHLQSWVIEVSSDGQSWAVIDSQSPQSTEALNHNFGCQVFVCASPTQDFVRYVRLRQTGLNSQDLHFLMLGQIEFFGTLREEVSPFFEASS